MFVNTSAVGRKEASVIRGGQCQPLQKPFSRLSLSHFLLVKGVPADLRNLKKASGKMCRTQLRELREVVEQALPHGSKRGIPVVIPVPLLSVLEWGTQLSLSFRSSNSSIALPRRQVCIDFILPFFSQVGRMIAEIHRSYAAEPFAFHVFVL